MCLYEVRERVAILTMNDPGKRNALGPNMVKSLTLKFSQAFEDSNVKVIILQATGPAFCAGADLEYLEKLQNNSRDENLVDSRKLKALFQLIYSGPKPVIALVTGHAIAGGAGLATICDLSFSIPSAKFGYTEVNIGFIPALVMVYLVRKVGEGIAKEWLITGKLYDAEKALRDHLIHGLFSESEIHAEVWKIAQHICKQTSGQSQALLKTMFNQIHHLEMNDALEYAASKNADARATDDCKRGIRSFLAKEVITW